MKQCRFTRSLQRAATLILSVSILTPWALATAGVPRITTIQTLMDGFSYVNTVSEHPVSGRVESHAFVHHPSSLVYPILIQAAGTVHGAATINQAVLHAQELGYHVLGGINTDFFTLGNGIPNGIVIEQGVYKSSPENYHAIAAVDGTMMLAPSPYVEIRLENQRDGSLVTLNHLNKWRDSAKGLYLYNEDFSQVSTRTDASGGRMVRFQVVEEDWDTPLTVNSSLTLEVVDVFETTESVPIGPNNYILTAAYESGFYEVFANYQVGDQVRLETICEDPVIRQAQWAGGCGDIMLDQGGLTDPATWTYARDGRNPRTAMGVKEDGTQVFYVADGRQPGYSTGLTQLDLAHELQAQGCVWAVNLDGGGSSVLSALLPGDERAAVVSSPSGGVPRRSATFLLFVTSEGGDGRPHRLALREDGPVVLTGTSRTLGDVAALDQRASTVIPWVSDVQFTSERGLGSLNGGIYTAGSLPGTEEVGLMSPSLGITGRGQVHVVDTLTELTITLADRTTPVKALTLEKGDQIALSAQGSYWGRPALENGQGVVWSVEGDVGTITPDGRFTASGNSLEGRILATAGGITQSLPVRFERIYVDVPPDHWAYEAVDYCYRNGLVTGISNTEFGPDLPIRRGDFLLMLYQAMGTPPVLGAPDFEDVEETDYYARAIAWAGEHGVASGVSDRLFAPTELVTREQAFTILHRVMSLLPFEPVEPDLSQLEAFQDGGEMAEYARASTAVLAEMGLLYWTGDQLLPGAPLTRAEMAVLLQGLMTCGEEPEPNPEPEPELSPDSTLTLSEDFMTLAGGQAHTLTALLTPPQDAVMQWRSSDPQIAAVTQDGTVVNVYAGSGTPTVTITVSCGPLSAQTTVACTPAEQVGRVTAEPSLNVRSGPDGQYPVIATLKYGQKVVVLNTSISQWYQVLFAKEGGEVVQGFVSSDYLDLRG